ncbi:hypothetical protein KC660_04395, partial [Candidatus Dojkabacteria bacterium]|nr:hypothetical protein [Candidatus Dojkabacteria bacterium]
DSNDDSKKNDSSDDVQAKDDSNTTTDDDYKLTTSTTSTGVKVMWNLKELNNSDYSGLRIIYSSTHTTPKYPGDYSTPPSNPDSYVYLSMAQTGSQVLKLTDGKKYYIRMCSVNREDLKCGDYSDTVVITAP